MYAEGATDPGLMSTCVSRVITRSWIWRARAMSCCSAVLTLICAGASDGSAANRAAKMYDMVRMEQVSIFYREWWEP
jgi:hypothetical protein